MSEINKLRTRLGNVQKNTVEYRMTVTEARNLLTEIDNLARKEVVKEVEVKQLPVPQMTRIMDGGTF